MTKPLLSLLSENFYSEFDVMKTFIKSDKDFLIQRIFNISILALIANMVKNIIKLSDHLKKALEANILLERL